MAKLKRVAVVIDMSVPWVHHLQIYAGIQRYSYECKVWECTLTPFIELLHADNKHTAPNGIIARADERLAEVARNANIPVVNVWVNSPIHGLPSVFPDVKEAGRMAASHFKARGFRKFAYMGHLEDRNSQLQLSGFLEELGVDCNVFWDSAGDELDSPEKWQSFQNRLRQWIASLTPPIGIFVVHDLLCRYAAEECRRQNLNVPVDVALIGSRNEVSISVSRDLSLSSIDYGYERIGYRAAELLTSLMEGNPAPPAPIILPPVELIARQSSDAIAVDNPILARALRFIAEKAHTGIDVEDVAAHMSASVRTLARLFKKHMKQNVYATITHMRLERAKRLLISSSDTIKEIATGCGFRDSHHLWTVFQRIEGLSPREFRDKRTARTGGLTGL